MISSVFPASFNKCGYVTDIAQEDESEIALRKMKEEDQEVDILTGVDVVVADHSRTNGDDGEDAAWADEEADEDTGGWRMKVVMEDEMDML